MLFQCWTAKEALLKACGLGIGAGLLGLELAHLGLEAREGKDAGGSLMLKGRSLHYHWLGDISGYGACIAYGQALSLEPGFSGGEGGRQGSAPVFLSCPVRP
ncbi:4'-phosphopantetheinyl transferase superfamily protein [Azotobacter sp. CWF10]